MRIPFCLAVLLASISSLPAADLAARRPSALGPVEDPALPLALPGYELRVLDRRKTVKFRIGDAQGEAALPIFIYYPTGDLAAATGSLREAYDSLQQLGKKPEWTAEELRQVLANLDQALRQLERPAPPSAP